MKTSENIVPRKKISRLVYIPAIISLLPIIGIPFGVSAILWGLSDWKIGGKKVVSLTGIGLFFSLLLVIVSYSFYNQLLKSPAVVDVKVSYSQAGLVYLVRYLEFYKQGHGHYPSSLIDLREGDNTSLTSRTLTDPFSYAGALSTGAPEEQPYYYLVSEDGNSYDLFSVGPDGIPYTQDDVYPIILDWYKSVVGLRMRNAPSP